MHRRLGTNRHGLDATDLGEERVEIRGVLKPLVSLRFESGQLRAEDRPLKLGEAIVTGKNEVPVPRMTFAASRPHERLAFLGERRVVGRDDTALARGHVLRVLERERTAETERATFLSGVRSTVRMRGLLH